MQLAGHPGAGSANHHMIDQVARTEPAARDIPLIHTAHAEYLDCLGKIDEHLKQTGNAFIVGDQLSIGDIPIAVSTRQLSLALVVPLPVSLLLRKVGICLRNDATTPAN
jgi:glutathione S-transferase